jgi:asparagine synthase (glutamine-hydrolysing)
LYVDREGIFTETFKKQLLKDRVLEQVETKDTLAEIFAGFLKQGRAKSIEDIVLYFDFKTQLADEYLRYTDTLSMAHSLEARVPFLDNELIEYAATIPFSHLVRGKDAKYLLKSALKDILPPGTTERKKGYFSLPYGAWLRADLRSFVLNTLSRTKIERLGYLSYEKVKGIIDEQYAGDDSKTYQVWSLLMFSLWHEMFIEKEISNISEIESMDFNRLLLHENTDSYTQAYEKA